MFRLAEKRLQEWKTKKHRKPLIVRGARQVGKSWLIKEHGKTYKQFIEINFEENKNYINLFGDNLNPDEILKNIKNYFRIKIGIKNTLLFLDEIQLCPRAISALRFFYEKKPELHVIAAGSLLEFELDKLPIPVGRIEFFYIKPLSFFEYLYAQGYSELAYDIIKTDFTPINSAIHKKLLAIFRDYTIIGGMPEAVNTYIEEGEDLRAAQTILSGLIDTYQADFNKYAKARQIKHLNLLFKELPLQTGRKIKYANLTRDTRAKELFAAIELLEKAGLIYKIYHSDCNGIPLGAETNYKKFKTILLDIGLTNQILGVNVINYLNDNNIHHIHNGAIAESVVGQELVAYPEFREKKSLYYWHREDGNSNAEIDYVIEQEGMIIPIEVKDNAHGRMRSLFSFMERKKPKYALKISKSPMSTYERVHSLPFYCIMSLFQKEIEACI